MMSSAEVATDTLAGMRPLLGRERELQLISRGLDEAAAGRGRLITLVGEPGIGKTRLADETAALASARNFAVFWGRCWEAGGAPAYWPWMDTLAQLVRGAGDGFAARGLGPGRRTAGRARARACASRLPATALGAQAPAAAAAEVRFGLWRAVAALVREASRAGHRCCCCSRICTPPTRRR